MADAAALKTILDTHADALTALPNVVGVGIGSGPDGGVIAVYVREKVAMDRLVPGAVVPAALSATVAGVRVEAKTAVVEVGDIRP